MQPDQWCHCLLYHILYLYFVEKKIKGMKCKHVDLPLNDDPAAGFRK